MASTTTGGIYINRAVKLLRTFSIYRHLAHAHEVLEMLSHDFAVPFLSPLELLMQTKCRDSIGC